MQPATPPGRKDAPNPTRDRDCFISPAQPVSFAPSLDQSPRPRVPPADLVERAFGSSEH